MEQNSVNNSPWIPQDIVKAIPAIAIGISSICFILGLLIVNLRLASFGIISTEFLRTEYVLAGAVLIILIGMAETSYVSFLKAYKHTESHWKEKKIAKAIAGFLIAIIILITPLFAAIVMISGKEEIGFKTLLLSALAVGFIWAPLTNIFTNIKNSIQIERSTIYNNLGQISVMLMMLLIGLSMYAHSTYPIISSAFGGGYRLPKVLHPTPRGLEVCKVLALPLQNNQTIGPIVVLTESEKELVLLIPDGLSGKEIAIRLNRDLFEAIQNKSSNKVITSF